MFLTYGNSNDGINDHRLYINDHLFIFLVKFSTSSINN